MIVKPKSRYRMIVEANEARSEAERAIRPYRLGTERARAENPGIIPPWEGEETIWVELDCGPRETIRAELSSRRDRKRCRPVVKKSDWRSGPLGASGPIPKPPWFQD